MDSTVGFNRNIGFRAGTALPYYFYDITREEPTNLLEVPLIFQDGALNGSYALELGDEMTRKTVKLLIGRIAETQGCATILYHPDSKFDNLSLRETYRWFIEYCLEQGAWVTSLKEIQQWWQKRAERLGV